jgi:hypothetical protein
VTIESNRAVLDGSHHVQSLNLSERYACNARFCWSAITAVLPRPSERETEEREREIASESERQREREREREREGERETESE